MSGGSRGAADSRGAAGSCGVAPAPGEERALGEFELIERFFVRSGQPRRSDVSLGIGDDAALIEFPAASELVVAVDTLVAGRHFPLDSTAHSIGHRALAVNLSDMAAMGATPAWATLALTLPAANADWLREFSAGLQQLADRYGVALVGGDTTAGPLTISVQILGHVARGTALRRGGAKAGDLIVVSGTLGDAGAGLALVTGRLKTGGDGGAGVSAGDEHGASDAAQLIARLEYPQPRVAFGAAARGVASAAMDISDGLVGDLPKLAAASGLGADVDVERLPLSRALRSVVSLSQAQDWALAAGDDYELLLTVPPQRYDELARVASELNLTLTSIGVMRAERGVRWHRAGVAFDPQLQGYDHFR